MKKFRFLDKGLAGDVFYPDPDVGPRPSSAGVFVYGFPAFVGPNAVTALMVQRGMMAVQPHYLGSYDSDGIYSPISLLDTCRVAGELFQQGHVTQSRDGKRFDIPSQIDVFVGHSFGCLVALRGIRFLPSIRRLVLMAPAVHYSRSNPDFGLHENGPEHLEYVRRSHPHTYRLAPATEWHELLTGKDGLPRHQYTHPSLEEVVAIVGEKDKYFDREALRSNLPVIVEAYCGSRARFSFHVVREAAHPVDDLVPAMAKMGLDRSIAPFA